MTLRKRYITAEVYDAPNAMGYAVSRQTVATLCARKPADPAKNKVSDEELAAISPSAYEGPRLALPAAPGTCRAAPGAGRLSRPPGRAEPGWARELVHGVSCSPAAGVASQPLSAFAAAPRQAGARRAATRVGRRLKAPPAQLRLAEPAQARCRTDEPSPARLRSPWRG